MLVEDGVFKSSAGTEWSKNRKGKDVESTGMV